MAIGKATAVFERCEKKYTVTRAQCGELLQGLKPFVHPDHYGKHTICNIYYDTDDYALIRKSLDKPIFKQKLRLRSYGVPGVEDHVFLELKKKLNGITYKRRIVLPLWQAEAYLNGTVPLPERTQIADEIDWFVHAHILSPKVVLCYDRIALQGVSDPELRITFDSGIRWRNYGLNLWRGDGGELLLPDGAYIMEIKTRSALPYALTGVLSDMQIYPSSFSKYGAVYRQLLTERGEVVRCAG